MIDNKMRAYGDIDFDTQTIRINANKNPEAKYNIAKKDELIDTYIHEIMHAKYPKMTEADIRKKTKEIIASLKPDEKNKLQSYVFSIAK